MRSATTRGRIVRAHPGFAAVLSAAGLDRVETLSARTLGEPVTDHRSSWVRRTSVDSYSIYVKTYDYSYARGRLRGVLRTTFLARGRATREWDALKWLREHGFEAPTPLALVADRRLGFLRRAVLVTQAHPGRALDRLLPELAAAERDQLLTELESFVERLHAAGFRDRNLDLRNLLAEPDPAGTGWRFAKIDSPRHRIVPAGPADDRLARADWNRLARSLGTLVTGF